LLQGQGQAEGYALEKGNLKCNPNEAVAPGLRYTPPGELPSR
jgi:hypothetical protein